jgi:hypothetical protein
LNLRSHNFWALLAKPTPKADKERRSAGILAKDDSDGEADAVQPEVM